MSGVPRQARGLSIGLLAGLIALAIQPAGAQIVPTAGRNGLNSLVRSSLPAREGMAGNGCIAGICTISGGTNRGSNVFHRLDQFRATGAISQVLFENSNRNVILVVKGPVKIDRPIALRDRADFALLSPFGLTLGRDAHGSASFRQIGTLLLTSSQKLAFGEQLFIGHDADLNNETHRRQLEAHAPFGEGLGSNGKEIATRSLQEGNRAAGDGFFTTSDAQSRSITIHPGVSLEIDDSLLLIANQAPLSVRAEAPLTTTLASQGNAAHEGLFHPRPEHHD